MTKIAKFNMTDTIKSILLFYYLLLLLFIIIDLLFIIFALNSLVTPNYNIFKFIFDYVLFFPHFLFNLILAG